MGDGMFRHDDHLSAIAELPAVSAVRRDARALLRQLEADRAASERRAAETGRRDALKIVTGRSALDNAVLTTERILHALEETAAPVERRETVELAHR